MGKAEGRKTATVVFCPKCIKPVETGDYAGKTSVLGFLDPVLPVIYCGCGYRGLPIRLTPAQYRKLTDDKGKPCKR